MNINNKTKKLKMKLRTYLAMAAMLLPTLMFAVPKKTPLFVCGFSASFNDSTVYFTEIQPISEAYADSKTGFLYSRDNYSYQLRDYMQKNGVPHPTCITLFAKTRKEIEKKYTSLKKRYTTKGLYNVKYITANEFSYTPITPDESELKEKPISPKKAKKEAKKVAKKEANKAKEKNK